MKHELHAERDPGLTQRGESGHTHQGFGVYTGEKGRVINMGRNGDLTGKKIAQVRRKVDAGALNGKEIAATTGVSEATVSRVKKGYTPKRKRPAATAPPKKHDPNSFPFAVLTEFLAVSHYRVDKAIRLLRPLLSRLSDSLRSEIKVSDRTIKRRIEATGLPDLGQKQAYEQGDLIVHCLTVDWYKCNDRNGECDLSIKKTSKLFLIFDKATGFACLHACTDSIAKSLLAALSKMNNYISRNSNHITKILFTKGTDTLLEAYRSTLEDENGEYEYGSVYTGMEIIDDEITLHRAARSRIEIPKEFCFADYDDFHQKMMDISNAYNRMDRFDPDGKRSAKDIPIERLKSLIIDEYDDEAEFLKQTLVRQHHGYLFEKDSASAGAATDGAPDDDA